MNRDRLDTYGPFMMNTAYKAGEIIRAGFDKEYDIAIKADDTPVTPIDKTIDFLVANTIQETFPDDAYLGEETGGNVTNDRFWVCDPLDGTKAYIAGFPLAAFSLSLIEEGEIVSSVIHDPFTHRMLLAAKGEGAWLNGKQTQVSDKRSLDKADVNISWGDEGYLHRLSSLRKMGAKVMKVDATIYVGMLLSSGRLEGDIFTGAKLWDIAPQSLAVREAGGIATTLNGDPVPMTENGQGLIISNGYIHEDLLTIVRESRSGV